MAKEEKKENKTKVATPNRAYISKITRNESQVHIEIRDYDDRSYVVELSVGVDKFIELAQGGKRK